jgi:hypothetical protein
MDWHDEERLLWTLEMARSQRDFENAMRAGLLPQALPGDANARLKDALTRSRFLIITSRALREESIRLRAASKELRANSCAPSFLKLPSAATP